MAVSPSQAASKELIALQDDAIKVNCLQNTASPWLPSTDKCVNALGNCV